MIPIALLEKFCCLTFISRVEFRNMIADSSELNKLRNVRRLSKKFVDFVNKIKSTECDFSTISVCSRSI